jgi:nucleotide-binding universal stress UspA family protein
MHAAARRRHGWCREFPQRILRHGALLLPDGTAVVPVEGDMEMGSDPIRCVVACLDGSELGERALPHALAAASALGAPLTLLRVLELAPGQRSPADPMEWEIRRREARDYLDRLARSGSTAEAAVEMELIEGRAAEEICRWTARREAGLTVACTHGAGGRSPWVLASTARKLLDRAPGSLLLVPAAASAATGAAHDGRVLVPLDGSPQAESVLPIALRIASAQRAELLVVHVVPVPELTEIGPLDAADLELRDRIMRRNERVARTYLDRVRAHLCDPDVTLRTAILTGGDVATRLARFAVDEHADLLVLAAHGRGGARFGTPCGGVTADLIARSSVPLLIVRSSQESRSMRRAAAQETLATRLPHHAAP